ncbi:hypothetical protein [Kribbella sp. NPDC048915]
MPCRGPAGGDLVGGDLVGGDLVGGDPVDRDSTAIYAAVLHT